MVFYVYILKSLLNERYYIGSSDNPNERLIQHNNGRTPSTRPYRPWILAYTEEYNDRSMAVKRELYLKKMKSRVYLQQLINGKSQ